MPNLKYNIDKIKKRKAFKTLLYQSFSLIFIIFFWSLYMNFISNSIFLTNIMYIIFSYLFLNVLFIVIRVVLVQIYLRRNNLADDHADNMTLAISRLSFFFNQLLFFMILINILVTDVRNLLTSLSIVAVAIVLTFKEYISNFLGGIYLLFSRDFRINDTVKIGELSGKIVDIKFSNIQLKNEFNDIIYVPNSVFLSKEVTNYSRYSLKNIVIEIKLTMDRYKALQKSKKKILLKIEKEYGDLISNKDQIQIYAQSIENDNVFVVVEICLSKYNHRSEKILKDFIITEISQLKI